MGCSNPLVIKIMGENKIPHHSSCAPLSYSKNHICVCSILHSGVVRPQRSPTALGYGQTPTPTPQENVGVTIYTYPSKNVLIMLNIGYFCKDDQVERAYLC